MKKLLSLAWLGLSGCATLHGDGADRQHVGPPRVDRCAQMGGSAQTCQKARKAALVMIRKLSVDDQVCIDGDHPLANPDRSCQVRGFVEEVAPNAVELEIRDAPPGSTYTAMSNWWFHEEALADLELRGTGYTLPGEAAK
jgi:hypothetical protein